MNKVQPVDVIVIGGGLVGCAFALSLMPSGLRVAIVDPSWSLQPASSRAALRVSALTRASESICHALGLPEVLAQATPLRRMVVWDKSGSGQIEFDSRELGLAQLGSIIKNHDLLLAMRRFCATNPNITLYSRAAQTLDCDDEGVQLQLDDETLIQGRLVVGADGAHSWLREHSAIALHEQAYQHLALVAELQTTQPHDHSARQWFSPTGPLAFLPLSDPHRVSIVWSQQTDVAQQLYQSEQAEFLQALQEASDHHLGQLTLTSERSCFPLVRRHANQYVKPRIALIGDAIHTIHPLAGQGLNLGLLDAAALAETLHKCQLKGRPIGALSTLRKYERWRKGHNMAMLAVMEGFYHLFGSDAVGLRWLRNTGLHVTNHMPLLKNQLMAHAMGLKGDLPVSASYNHSLTMVDQELLS